MNAGEGGRPLDGQSGLTRREFLGLASGLTLLFGTSTPGDLFAAQGAAPALVDDLNAWLRIGPDGRVTVFAPTPEVGQGLRTSLAQLAAEELCVPLSSVEVILGDTDRVPPDPGVCASEAISTIGAQVRQAAAEAREMLAELAAERWGVTRDQVVMRAGRAAFASDPQKAIPIGEIAAGQRLARRARGAAKLKPVAEHEVVGRSLPRTEGRAYVTGRARYVGDVRLPNMLYGRVLYPPCLGAKLVSVETRAAAGQPGVVAVVREDDFVGVVANKPDAADRGLLSVQATWQERQQASMKALYQDLRASAKLDQRVDERGDVEGAMAAARHGYSASYRLPFIAHAPIEPHGAVAEPREDRIVVYASTQRPFAHRDAVAAALGMSPARVRVIAAAVGGAFGGKDAPDISVHAARLARAVGQPVMVVQSREEEMARNYFRPAALIDIRCGVTEQGDVQAWDCDVFNCGARGAVPPYDFPNRLVRCYRCTPPLPQGPWRALAGPANAFAREVHLDHVASELREDPVALRLRYLGSEPRMERAVRAAAEAFGWKDRHPPTGLGAGFACAEDAGSFAAVIAEVEVTHPGGQFRVRRVRVAQDSGLIVNPDNALSQIEGAVVMGLGFTLKEAVRWEQGRVLTTSFASYPIPTFSDAPDLEMILVANPDHPPQGEGTAALCAIAPAVANAVFDATGRRVRDLPVTPATIRGSA